ncbi:MAG: tRNA 2-selenouridine(34) synthase MnmH [Planctomycetota bacterium]
MRIPALPYEQIRQLPEVRWVDLRSPAEFERDHVPEAINVPLFDDAQRAIVGALYHQVSQEHAYEKGLAYAESGMPEILEKILGQAVPERAWKTCFEQLRESLRAGQNAVELVAEPPAAPADGRPPLALHCWRGGMRSRSVAALIQTLGHPVVLLEEGYKGYRNWAMDQLDALQIPPLIILRGPTGVGKTEILQQLEQREPGTTLCLESLAQHRSSILGAVGKEPVSQPSFETRLLCRMAEMGPGPWFVEGESRKVGDVILPLPLFQAMEDGTQWLLQAQTATRVRNLMEDYLATDSAVEDIRAKLPFLEKRIGKTWVGQLDAWMTEGKAAEVTEVLLERYYDPLYAHSDQRRSWSGQFEVEAPDLLDQLLEGRRSLTG